MPSFDVDVSFKAGVENLKQSVTDIGLLGSDLFTFVADKDGVTIITSKDIPTKYENNFDVEYDGASDKSVSSTFKIDFIKQMLKFNKVNSNINLKIGDNLPLKYLFKDELNGIAVSGMIAPILSEEE